MPIANSAPEGAPSICVNSTLFVKVQFVVAVISSHVTIAEPVAVFMLISSGQFIVKKLPLLPPQSISIT